MSGVDNELLLLISAVECGILSPKSKWKSIVDRIESYVCELEGRVVELEKLRKISVIDNFSDKS
jgi:hypothetical protein